MFKKHKGQAFFFFSKCGMAYLALLEDLDWKNFFLSVVNKWGPCFSSIVKSTGTHTSLFTIKTFKVLVDRTASHSSSATLTCIYTFAVQIDAFFALVNGLLEGIVLYTITYNTNNNINNKQYPNHCLLIRKLAESLEQNFTPSFYIDEKDCVPNWYRWRGWDKQHVTVMKFS